MKRSIRLFLFAVASVAVAAMVLAGAAGLPGFGNYPGPYGDLVVASAGPDRHVTNVPTSINFDYRGLDTLGEEYILFAAAAALALLLRKEPGDGGRRSRKEPRPPGDIIRWTGLLLFGPLAVFGDLRDHSRRDHARRRFSWRRDLQHGLAVVFHLGK